MCSAVPPRFPINDWTLSNRQPSVFAVTGNPVPVYFLVDFFGKSTQTTSALFACGDFHLASPSLSGNLARTTSEWLGLYAGAGRESRMRCYTSPKIQGHHHHAHTPRLSLCRPRRACSGRYQRPCWWRDAHHLSHPHLPRHTSRLCEYHQHRSALSRLLRRDIGTTERPA